MPRPPAARTAAAMPARLLAAGLVTCLAAFLIVGPHTGTAAASPETRAQANPDPGTTWGPPEDPTPTPSPSPEPTERFGDEPSPTPSKSAQPSPSAGAGDAGDAGDEGNAEDAGAGGADQAGAYGDDTDPATAPTATPGTGGGSARDRDREEPEEEPLREDAIMAGEDILKAGALTARDAEAQAMLVDVEDQRLLQIRAALTALLQTGGVEAARRKQPQVFVSAHGRTLVLPARHSEAPYTIRDLAAVENGRYLRRLKDGSYLLGVHVFLADGATLQLRGPLTLRMGSLPGSFSSIVSFGGDIKIQGTARRPVRITSWDVRTRRADTVTNDGRAYIRAVGGRFEMAHTQVSHLGFWSGRTGGVALTGTERPASVYRHRTKRQRHQDKRERLERNGQDRGGSNFGDVETSPIGPGTASHVLADELVSGSIRNSTINGNAYGLFVSGSNQSKIIDSAITNSLVHGLVMHRFAKNATIEGTKVIGSGGDGFVLSRATEKVRITDSVAERNGRNGFTLNGRALADGPSASGESLNVYGDNSVNNSVARDNRRYGVEVLGGTRLAVHTSEIVGGDMGIVVRAGARGVQISGNRLTGQARHAIALRDGAAGAHVAGNTITGAVTGIHLRDSTGKIVGNSITTANKPKAHGITLVGVTGDTEITRNTVVGSGTSAISLARSDDRAYSHNNDVDRWNDTSSLWVKFQRYLKPMNLIWAGVFLLIVMSAIRGRSVQARRMRGGVRDPYELQKALEERPVRELATAGRADPRGPMADPVHAMSAPGHGPAGWFGDGNGRVPHGGPRPRANGAPNGISNGGSYRWPNGGSHGGPHSGTYGGLYGGPDNGAHGDGGYGHPGPALPGHPIPEDGLTNHPGPADDVRRTPPRSAPATGAGL